jgi:hypothetical protein
MMELYKYFRSFVRIPIIQSIFFRSWQQILWME